MNSGGSVVLPSTSMEVNKEWRKRKLDPEEVATKKPRVDICIRLETESPIMDSGDEDLESVYSIQDKETDVAKDTTDTDTISDSEDTDFELEYEVATGSEVEDFPLTDSSSGTDDMRLAEGVIAAVLCDSSVEAWITDTEASDSSSTYGGVGMALDRVDSWTCVQCKSLKSNAHFRYCEKCFQRCWHCKTRKTYKCFTLCKECFKVRKNLFPPRPRGKRKRKVEKKETSTVPKVNLETVKSCIRRISEDSSDLTNISRDRGSSQDIPKWDFDKIVVPEHLKSPRKYESSESDYDEPLRKKSKCDVDNMFPSEENPSSSKSLNSVISDKSSVSSEYDKDSGISDKISSISSNSEDSKNDLCIMCNSNPKNGIFLHGSIGHMCCCYKCAMKSWKTSKRCPMCNCKVKNVVKLFTR